MIGKNGCLRDGDASLIARSDYDSEKSAYDEFIIITK